MSIKQTITLLLLTIFLSSCRARKELPAVRPKSDLDIAISALFNGDNEDKVDELYFYDSKGRSYIRGGAIHSDDIVDNTLLTLLDELFDSAKRRLRRKSRSKKINVAIEMGNRDSEHGNQLLSRTEEYVVSKSNLSLQAQDEEVKNVIAKIVKRELDPFYSKNGEDISAQTSDLILYIQHSLKGNLLTIKASILTKRAEVLATKSEKVDISNVKADEMNWIYVKVPKNDNSGTIAYKIMQRPVSEKEYKGQGSENRPVTNVSFEDANNFCNTVYEGALLSSPYVFEFARRTYKLKKPGSPALEEMIAPLDLEDRDDIFFREGDTLAADEEDVSTMIMFRWNAEKYYSVSFSYKSPQITFRCYR